MLLFSTLLELAGFAAITVAALLLAGPPAALLTGGMFALLAGYATDDERAVASLVRATLPVRRRAHALQARRERRRRKRELAKAG